MIFKVIFLPENITIEISVKNLVELIEELGDFEKIQNKYGYYAEQE